MQGTYRNLLKHLHDAKSSCSARQNPADKHVAICSRFVVAIGRLRAELTLTARQQRAFSRRLSEEYFWHLDTTEFWEGGHRCEALSAYSRSLALWPWRILRWKTFVFAWIRTCLADSSYSIGPSLNSGGSA